MTKIAFLCSGGGGNLKFVSEAIRLGWINGAQICAVLSDRECGANAFARARGLATEVMDFSAAGQSQVVSRLQEMRPDVIVTTVHKILTPQFVSAFRGKLVNLHYSLLPAFAAEIGDRPVRQALAYGAKFVGITVHWVDEQVDMGRPIVQAITATTPNLELNGQMTVLFRSGCIGLLHTIATLQTNSDKKSGQARSSMLLGGQVVHFNPAMMIEPTFEGDLCWAFLK